MKDGVLSQYLAGAAYHNYGGDREEPFEYAQSLSGKRNFIFTETSIGTWNSGREFVENDFSKI